MYYVSDKKQLHSFISELRKLILEKYHFAPKPQKFKELIACCLSSNSYAHLVSCVENEDRFYIKGSDDLRDGPIIINGTPLIVELEDVEPFDMSPNQVLAYNLNNEPYSINVKFFEIERLFLEALEKQVNYDAQIADELLMNSVLSACDSVYG